MRRLSLTPNLRVLGGEARVMSDDLDPVELADELASIARSTQDPVTGARLLQVVRRLLTQAGLPADDLGGGGLPSPWVSEPVCEPA